ncbi:MAG TPA: hypothetical protein VE082_00315, partial [Desulfobaccales bacterium]|nr:hypothetical protein [Desulfobaccales bacterium]
ARLYEVRGMAAPYNIRLPEKLEKLEKLPEKLSIQLHHLKDKIVTESTGQAWVTHLCDTAARITTEGKLEAWEDVRLTFLDDHQEPISGHIYGKITRVKPLDQDRFEILVSFTSVPAQIYRTLRRKTGEA